MHFWLDICHYIPIEIRVPISPTEGWDMLPTYQKNRQYSLESNDPTWMCIPLSKWMYTYSYSSYILPYGGELTMVMTIEPTPHLHPQVAYLSYSPLPPNKSYDLLLNPIKIGSNPLAKSKKNHQLWATADARGQAVAGLSQDLGDFRQHVRSLRRRRGRSDGKKAP